MDEGRLVDELRSVVAAARELRQLYEARRYAEAHAARARIMDALERIRAMWTDKRAREGDDEVRRLMLELVQEIETASHVASSDPSGVMLSFLTYGRKRPGRKPRQAPAG